MEREGKRLRRAYFNHIFSLPTAESQHTEEQKKDKKSGGLYRFTDVVKQDDIPNLLK